MAATRNIIDEGRTLWGKLTPGRRAIVIGAAAATLAGALFLSTRSGGDAYETLYSGLAAEDAGKVVEALKAQNVPYRIGHDGTTIEAPAARVAEVRILLAQAGLPRGGGLGFELFDKQAFGTSSFLEQVNYRRALQGELERSILTVESIARARVHLAVHERSLYKSDDEPSTASVVISLKPGMHLAEPQVRGVVHLVASSVQGLSPEHITIVDERGVSLWSGEDGTSNGGPPEVERQLSRRVREMLERVVGVGHAQVVVTADIDSTRSERTEELYDKDRTALRSESRTLDGAAAGDPTTGGVAGAHGNLPGAPAPTTTTTTAGGKGDHHLSETRNYEVTRVVNKTTSPKSHLRRLHVAVLVDGVHKDPADPKSPMVPRAAEEIAHLTALAREAAGIDAERGDRIEVLSTGFASADADAPASVFAPVWRDRKVLIPAGAIALAMLIGLVVLVMRATRRRGAAMLVPTRGLPMPASELAEQIEVPPAPKLALSSAIPRDRAHEAISQDASRAARILTSWMSEREEIAR